MVCVENDSQSEKNSLKTLLKCTINSQLGGLSTDLAASAIQIIIENIGFVSEARSVVNCLLGKSFMPKITMSLNRPVSMQAFMTVLRVLYAKSSRAFSSFFLAVTEKFIFFVCVRWRCEVQMSSTRLLYAFMSWSQ